jgi:hypothetical protein
VQDPVARHTRRGLAVFTTLLAVATAAGFLDRFSWVFEPATLFRFQYAAVLLVTGALALALRWLRLALAAFVLAAVNIAVIAPWQDAALAAGFADGVRTRLWIAALAYTYVGAALSGSTG